MIVKNRSAFQLDIRNTTHAYTAEKVSMESLLRRAMCMVEDDLEHILEIRCGAEAFNILRRDIQHNYSPLNFETTFQYVGFPLTVTHSNDIVKDLRIHIVTNQRTITIEGAITLDTLSDGYDPIMVSIDKSTAKNTDDESVLEDDLMRILNGGGYKATRGAAHLI